ncbi:MAG: methyltransferase domain-containing protein [Blastocatellia bacterium]
MSDNASTGFPFQCVLCDSLLQEDVSQNLICPVCEACYPTLEGVRILVMNPEGLLSAHARLLSSGSRDSQSQNDPSAFLEGAQISAESLSILARSREGVLANDALASEFYRPVYKYLSRQKSGEGVIGLLTSYPSGGPFHYYTSYFYRDWYGTEEAEFVNTLFTDAIKKYCGGGEQVAVLGCGACGLLYSVSKFFRQSIAVDLSVPALFVANHLLRGGKIDLSINLPHDRFPKVQKVVSLNGATEAREGISLIAANIINLPFPSSSLSCVTTQYVMDAVSNQRLLATEIHRVLADDGIWINFGIPVGATTSDTATHLDLPWFLDHIGFEAHEISLQRYKHLDYSALSDWRTTVVHNNIFFVAGKNQSPIDQHPDSFIDYFAAKSNSILDKAPRLSSELKISISRRKEFGAGGISEKNEVRVSAMGSDLLNMEIPVEAGVFLDRFLHSIDGKRSVAEINDSLVASFGPVVNERELIMALKSLRDAALLEIA